MRRSRRGSRGVEFPSSGEDSFVAVVVTKLTGALLFILLLTMVIMALLPRAAESLPTTAADPSASVLEITTPPTLPEAIAGRPYHLALAATGTTPQTRWSLIGALPEGLVLDPSRGRIEGTPTRALDRPVELTLIVSDGPRRASGSARLVVYEPAEPLALASRWLPRRPRVLLTSWLENGFGFLVLLLVHAVGINAIGSLESRASVASPASGSGAVSQRFTLYRVVLRLATVSALAALAIWLVSPLHH